MCETPLLLCQQKDGPRQRAPPFAPGWSARGRIDQATILQRRHDDECSDTLPAVDPSD